MEPANQSVTPPGPSRGWWSVLLVFSFLWIGLIAGMGIGARFFVPPGSGLAGPAIALAYGLGGAVVCGVLAAVLSRRIEPRQLRFLAMMCATLSILSFGYFVTVAIQKQAAIQREQAPTRPLIPTEPVKPL